MKTQNTITTLLVGVLMTLGCGDMITEPELPASAASADNGREGSKDDGFWESLFGGGSDDAEPEAAEDVFTDDTLAADEWEGDSLCETMMDTAFFTEDDGLNIDCDEPGPLEEAPLFTDDNPWAMAMDVDAHHVMFPEWLTADSYDYPSASGFSLGGTEFWQKWTGGENPTYNFADGTAFGRRCMNASAIRFEAIMNAEDGIREALEFLKDSSNWSGSFFNWNDDYSLSTWGDGSAARLWAWRTTLVKWISQTNKDGSCFLPTAGMVADLATDCLMQAGTSGGEIQGCTGTSPQ